MIASAGEEDLFDRLTVIHTQLVENTDRWLLSGRDRPVEAFLARAALRRERDEIEEELRRRYLPTTPNTDAADSHLARWGDADEGPPGRPGAFRVRDRRRDASPPATAGPVTSVCAPFNDEP